MKIFSELSKFRKQAYELLGKGRDSLCDLMDAVLTSRSVSSFAELSLSPVFRRSWSSLYKVLERSEPCPLELLKRYGQHVERPKERPLLLVGDHTAWPRPEAVTLKERTYEHSPQGNLNGHPVCVGQGYSSLVCVPEAEGSWTLPLLHERITSFESPIEKAATQLRQVCEVVNTRPLSLWDSEYGCVRFVKLTADIACDKLIRLRPNRVLYGPPAAYQGIGRPPKHGEKFKLKDSSTWPDAQECLEFEDDKLGSMRLRRWDNLHFRESADHPMTLILVERLDESGQLKQPPLWLLWLGQDQLALESLARLYLERFSIEHWYRFLKQRLHWCLPRLGTREQSETWSHLMPLMTWQLWLARGEAQDQPLPWQKPFTHKTPGRVAQGFAAILARISSPASAPKPRGKSPGWPAGSPRTPRIRFPTVKKTYSPPKSKSRRPV